MSQNELMNYIYSVCFLYEFNTGWIELEAGQICYWRLLCFGFLKTVCQQLQGHEQVQSHL